MGNVKPTRNEVHPNSNYIVSLTQLSLHLGGIGRQTLDHGGILAQRRG